MNVLKSLPRLAACLLVLFAALAAIAQPRLQVEGAWVRTSPSPTGTAAYMRLTAGEPLTLVGVSTPVAGVAEVHDMKLEGDIMRMRAVPALELPAGKTVELKPGGLHLMLMDLKAPLRGEVRVPVTLLLRDAKGAERRLELQVPVAPRAPGIAGGAKVEPVPAGAHGHGHKH